MSKILVTGACGYIGSHTLVDLIENDFEVVSIDDNSRSSEEVLDSIKEITGVSVKNYQVNLCDFEKTKTVFQEHPDIEGIIHFAAYKTVPESVDKPLLYYRNNLNSLINLLELSEEFQTPYFIFSSSCSVYGDVTDLPVTENTSLVRTASPYGNTKKVGEEIIEDFSKNAFTKSIALRYFNPIGAHPSGKIGETPFLPPQNLMPIITENAIGKRDKILVFGNDYPTRDGSCIRDYIHVSDIAHAHTLAFKYLKNNTEAKKYDVLNIGSGEGVTVLEMLEAFEKATGQKLNYEIAPRRQGDTVAIYANNDKLVKALGWSAKFNLNDMMETSWNWEKTR